MVSQSSIGSVVKPSTFFGKFIAACGTNEQEVSRVIPESPAQSGVRKKERGRRHEE